MLLLVLLVLLSQEVISRNLASPPNILFILADDMGQWAAGCYGNNEIHTPNIDRLAREGLLFRNAFCNTPVCSASRASYFTGRLPSQHGIHDWLSGGNGCEEKAYDYMQEEVFYTDVLHEHGYQCAMSGKYHLGDQPVPQHSFSHWYVHQRGGGSYVNPSLVVDGKCVDVPGYVTDLFTSDAVNFLENEWERDTPFYMSVHYTAPHSPYVGYDGRADSEHPKAFVNLYENCSFKTLPQEPENAYAKHTGPLTKECLGNKECLKGYFAAVSAMDYNIGRLLSLLEVLGIDEETLVVFTSDHGFNAGQHGLWGKGNAAYPQNMFDTSLKIPLIFRHTGTIKPGVESSMVQVIDIGPTLLQYAANLSFPHDKNVAGVSYADILLDRRLRNKDGSVRNLFGEYGRVRYARNDSYKYVTRLSNQIELYDLKNDPDEKNNLLTGLVSQKDELLAHQQDRSLREYFSYYEDPFLTGWVLPVDGKGQERPILYNSSGMPTTPAFSKLTYI